jgi:hypothetical protein
MCVLICVFAAVGFVHGQTRHKPLQAGPSSFYPDDEDRGFKDAQPPSDAVLDALLKTPEADEMREELEKLDREDLRSLFSVVKAHLKNSNEIDEVVIGKDPMSGADNDWFWIVRVMGGHAQILLFANGNGIDFLRTRTNGYREIESVWYSAAGYSITRLYRYDGTVYKLARERTRTHQLP